ncbi:MAG: hypothetical protein WD181_03150 [Solirubrobacterales bacterium]
MNVSASSDEKGDLAERVVGELENYQRLSIEVLTRHEADPEAGLKALVALHLSWTEKDPERARMVSRHRNEVAAGPLGERLANSNQIWFGQMKVWIDSQVETGRMVPVSFNLLHAVVFAPTQEIAKLWLAGRLKRSLSSYADGLAEAAWASVKALPVRLQAP